MNSISAAAPTVTRPVGRRPVTRLVNRTRDPPPRTSSRADDRVQFRDRRPRYLPVRSRGGVPGMYASASEVGNGTLVPIGHRRRSGASGHQDGTLVPGARAHHPRRRAARDSGYPVTHARTPPPRPPRARARVRAPRGVRRRRAAVVRSDGVRVRRTAAPPVPTRTWRRSSRRATRAHRRRRSIPGATAPPTTSARSRPRASGRCASPAGPGRSGPSELRSSRSSARRG